MKATVSQVITDLLLTDGFPPKSRPEWRSLLVEAVEEEVEGDMATIMSALGSAMARKLSVEELRAGLIILGASSKQGEDSCFGSQTISEACKEAISSPGGRAFIAKFVAHRPDLEKRQPDQNPMSDQDLQRDIVVMIMPGALRQFGEKAEAAEAARAAGR